MIIFTDLDIPQMFYEVIQLHMVCSVFDKLLFDKVIPVSVARLDGDNSRFYIMNIILILFQGHCYDRNIDFLVNALCLQAIF